jgi:hypothetical protein
MKSTFFCDMPVFRKLRMPAQICFLPIVQVARSAFMALYCLTFQRGKKCMAFRTLYDRTKSPAEICRKIQKSSPETLNRAAFHAVLIFHYQQLVTTPEPDSDETPPS